MNRLTLMKNAVTSKVGRQILLGRKYSPQILFAAGTVAVITGTVLACRSTLKVQNVLDNYENQKQDLAEKTAGDFLDSSISSDRLYGDAKNSLNKLKVETGLEIAKLYALPVVTIGLGIGALTGSHVILSKRNSALTAAYVALDNGYKRYRELVVKDHGEEADRRYAAGVDKKLVEEKLADGTTKTTSVDTIDGQQGRFGGSMYARVFDEFSPRFSREPGMNSMFLSTTQHWANDKLRAQGYLFLNDVYKMLGLEPSEAGQIVGWVYKPHEEDQQVGDEYISFSLFAVNDDETSEMFLEGRISRVVLDFNVAGPVYHLLGRKY